MLYSAKHECSAITEYYTSAKHRCNAAYCTSRQYMNFLPPLLVMPESSLLIVKVVLSEMILMKKDLIVHSAQVVDEHILRPGDARIHEDILDEAADEHILLPGDARILEEGLGAGLAMLPTLLMTTFCSRRCPNPRC